MLNRAFWVGLLGSVALVGCSNQPSNAFQLKSSLAEVTEEGRIELLAEVGGEVSKVEFFEGSRKIGEDFSAPYLQEVNLTLDHNGELAFTARATMSNGNIQSSTTQVKVNISHVKGRVYQTARSGGNTLAGATVILNFGQVKAKATTGVDGSFKIPVKGRPLGFDILVLPPPGNMGLRALSYDSVPLSAYVSNLGASRELNIYLPGGPQALNPVASPRFGCISGRLVDTDGTTPVVGIPLPGANAPNRTSPAACNGSRPPGLSLLAVPLQPGETGLLTYRGFQGVLSGTGGNFLMPVISSVNSFATEGFVWAGNFNGTDTGNPATASEFFWSKFAYIPQVKTFLNNGQVTTLTTPVQLQPFDPTSNPSVTTIPFSHDTSALTSGGFDFSASGNALSLTEVSFEPSVTGGSITLGTYFDFSGGPRNLRVYKIPTGKQGQTLASESQALKFDAAGNLAAFSVVYRWFNGTNLSANKADFMAVPVLQTPSNGTTNVSRNPRLTWSAVDRPAVYTVTLYDGDTGAPVLTTYTPETFLNIYQIKLEPNKVYFWDVAADENLQMIDIISVDPDAQLAARHIDLNSLNALRGTRYLDNRANLWRGQLAESFLNSVGYVPQTGWAPGSIALVQLLERGYRFSGSEVFAFKTGN
jgi:hypothetical protein